MFPTFTAFFTAISEAFRSLTTFKEKQCETRVLKKEERASKAIECAEKIIFYVENKYPDIKKYRRYRSLKAEFFKYN